MESRIKGTLMHRYFYDFEFEENGETIIPISLGMVAEDGRELYIINKQYMQTYIDQVGYAWKDKYSSEISQWLAKNVCNHIDQQEVDDFGVDYEDWPVVVLGFISNHGKITDRNLVQLWGYFSAYDHVSLAQIFGPMIGLPEPIPMFTHDLKQVLGNKKVPYGPEYAHHALSDARWNKRVWEDYVMPRGL